MRIGIPSTFPPFRGGIAAFNQNMAEAFSKAGHDVVCVNWTRQYPKILFPGTSQYALNAAPSVCPAVVDSINPWTWAKAAEVLQADGPLDVAVLPFWHAFLSASSAGIAGQIRRNHPATRIIGLMHNAGSHDGPVVMEHLTRRFVSKLDEVWTLSSDVSARVASMSTAKELEIKTLFHPLYDHFPPAPNREASLAQLGLPADAEVYLFFGLIRPYKGLMRLLEVWDAFARVRPSAHLLIAGECYGDWGQYERAIESLRFRDRVHAANAFVPDAQVGIHFGAANAVILPYERASQSGVTAMALHYGVPTVASDVGGLSEYITSGQTGELFTPRSSPSLLEALSRVAAHDPGTSVGAFAQARRDFSWAQFAERGLAHAKRH